MENEVELGQIPSNAVQQIPEVRSSSNTRWPADLVISIISSLLCFPPLGILNFIKSRQYRKQTLSQDAVQSLSRDSRQIALISCFMGVTFIAMITIVMLLQFLYFQLQADDMKLSWRREYYTTTLNLTAGLTVH
ncbi:proline-rich transmembrane 1 [Paramuricea clavata]|uniref:Proline-rich transmembrane 1 n=1 Tax=Paramuricea clavata TaxID=317549 RepID=A0A7D9DB09_PARCT|nr:proline-rich transmembrane 1 [Paramuricea clavata]